MSGEKTVRGNTLAILAPCFPPQRFSGGPAVSLDNLVRRLRQKENVYVLSENYDLHRREPLDGVTPYAWNERDGVKAYYFTYREMTFRNVVAKLREIDPDILYCNSFFSAETTLPALWYARHAGRRVRVILAPRGEFGEEKLRGKPLKKRLYKAVLSALGLLKNVTWQGTGEAETEEIRRFIGRCDCVDLMNLPSVPSEAETRISKSAGELRLCWAARIHPIKNLMGALEALNRIVPEVTVIFDLYGPMEDEGYWADCAALCERLPANVKVTYRGCVEHEQMAQLLHGYHALFLPTLGENFGQSIAEALMNARPVLISDRTPWRAAEEDGVFVRPPDDAEGFAQVISRLARMPEEEYAGLCERAAAHIRRTLDTDGAAAAYNTLFGR